MQVPFFDLKRLYQEQKEETDFAIARVVEKGSYILGEACRNFEDNLKQYFLGSKAGTLVSCGSGTDALVLSLLGSGIVAGDEVVTVSNTAIPTITAIREVGAFPVFVDVHPETWLMDLEALESSMGPRTKAIIAVHLYGNMVAVPKIRQLLEKMGREDVCVIEDTAQALGSRLDGDFAGTLGRYGAFSFYPTKNLGAIGDGGAVFCPSADDGDRVRALRNYGQKDRGEVQVSRGINSRLDELQAAILNVRLQRVDVWNERKAAMMERYRQELAGLPVTFPQATPGCRPAWHLGVIAMENSGTRDRLIRFLAENKVETLVHYPVPAHLQLVLATPSPLSLPVTEKLAKTVLSLPLNAVLLPEEQEWVIETVTSFFAQG